MTQPITATIRKNIYQLVSKVDKSVIDILILCYHSVGDDDWRFTVEFETLKKQIDYLLMTRTPIRFEDLEMFLSGKKYLTGPSFIITFDDGYKNILQTVEFFKSRKISPAVFLLSDTDHANRQELGNNLPLLTAQQVLTLKQAGWTLGSHGATHSDFNKLNDRSLIKEIAHSKVDLENATGIGIKYFSYPKGVYRDKAIEMVKQSGYSLAVSMDDGFITRDTHRYMVPRVGVDKTHSLDEFKVLYSPSVMRLRGFLKKTPVTIFFK